VPPAAQQALLTVLTFSNDNYRTAKPSPFLKSRPRAAATIYPAASRLTTSSFWSALSSRTRANQSYSHAQPIRRSRNPPATASPG